MASITSGKTKRINILLNDVLNRQLKSAAKQSKITTSAFVRVALEREFARDKALDLECRTLDLDCYHEVDQE
ncbi:MAG: ribbon-helix-helix domain-containing protein [Anaerolineales bacterium]|nr:ribbon-helix-helix domain-containing protein [Anaerolineales bacterium]